ncbi:MAG: aminopeptidase P N-terminal domain-containing protein [Planctomycetota bacterium]|jgi:Xaa-Pro aminopeptidase
MFAPNVYIERRKRLRTDVESGVILFLGNEESPMNYPDNQYPFRQDECIFGDDLTVDDIVWTGPQPSLKEKCQEVGISQTAAHDQLPVTLIKAAEQGRKIHFLPQYRADNVLKIEQLLDVSEQLVRAVIAQRSIKTEDEITQIEKALDIAYEMQTTAMKMSKPGIYERQVAGAMEAIALSHGGRLSFPTIFSVHGETLHNHFHGNLMKDGDIAVNDSGAESTSHYASDITRTIPVSGKFSQRQKDIYAIVLDAQNKAIDAIKPCVEFRNIHRLASEILVSGLKGLGLVKGDVSEAVQAGVHTLFFQCGLGHMMGLDVHDMEGLGEDYVGYTDTIKRNPEFGWRSLRLAKALKPGFVITVEPGLYFIPELIDRWKAEQKNAQYINYDAVEKYGDFGGIRIEDDVLITQQGCRILGKPIPRTIEEVEAMSS